MSVCRANAVLRLENLAFSKGKERLQTHTSFARQVVISGGKALAETDYPLPAPDRASATGAGKLLPSPALL